MSRLREVLAAVSSVALLAVACSDGSDPAGLAESNELTAPTKTEIAAGPAACAEWSCNELVCGHPTLPPYHACCVRGVEDYPGSPSNPSPVEPEPNCALLPPDPDDMPSECIATGSCQTTYRGCEWNGSTVCPSYCSSWDNSCTEAIADCNSASPPWCDGGNQ